MKLSNQQVKALAEKIKNELIIIKVNPIKEFNISIYDSEEYKNFINNDPDCLYLEELYKRINNSSKYHYEQIQSLIKNKFFESKFKKVQLIDENSIMNEIHLATIDSNDLTQLIEKVTEKFK